MKFIKGFLTFILGILLVGVITILSVSLGLKKTVSKNISNVLSSEAIYGYISDDLNDAEKEIIINALKDSEAPLVMDVYINNYLAYKKDSTHKVNRKDADIIINYINRHTSELKDTKIPTSISLDDIDSYAKESYEWVSNEIDSDLINTISIYKEFTSIKILICELVSIVILIGFIMLITWSLIKWVKVTSITLIISSILNIAAYLVVTFLTNQINSEIIKLLNFDIFLIVGIILFVIGIIGIIIYNLIKKKDID